MSVLMPDAKAALSGWGTPNYYFYELRNMAGAEGHEVWISLTINSKDIPDDLRAMSDRINKIYPVKNGKPNWLHRLNFTTRTILCKEDMDPEKLINQLDQFLEEIEAFEIELVSVLKGRAMDQARAVDVQILFLPCHVEPESLIISENQIEPSCFQH